MDIFRYEVSRKESKGIDQQQKEAKVELEELAKLARTCLSHEDFKRYRKQYEKAESKIMEAMMQYTRHYLSDESSLDVNHYAGNIIRMITRLDDMRMLLRQVEIDSQRG